MSTTTTTRRFGRCGAVAFAALTFAGLIASPAQAQAPAVAPAAAVVATAPAATFSAAPAAVPAATIQYGDAETALRDNLNKCGLMDIGVQGDCVFAAQYWLNIMNGEHLPLDAQYGPNTKGAVARFQAAYGLSPDGQMGQFTKTALENAVADMLNNSVATPRPIAAPGDAGEVREVITNEQMVEAGIIAGCAIAGGLLGMLTVNPVGVIAIGAGTALVCEFGLKAIVH